MIAEILNRQFVLEQLKLVRPYLAGEAPDRRRSLDLPFEPDDDQYRHAERTVRAAIKKEEADSSGQKRFEPKAAEHRGKDISPIDDLVFFSHDPIVSLMQTALEEYFRTEAPEKLQETSIRCNRRGSQHAEPLITQVSIAQSEQSPGRNQIERRILGAMSETDPRWLACWMAEGIRLFRGKHPFNDEPAKPFRIGNKARLILVGDWGSGIPRAIKVAEQMRKVIDEGKTNRVELHVIHLGDVYYSGWKSEYQERFLNHWPVWIDEAKEITSWCLNGNHDMYSGGHAYFDSLLADPRFARQQKSSFFSLFNDNWQILGLDTAYEDSGLRSPQATWVKQMLSSSQRKSMLLSHHQLFSAYDEGCPKLERRLGDVLKTGIDCWFWGHEHRCVFYEPYKNVRNARLIGHGGVPVYMFHPKNAAIKKPAFYEFREFLTASLGAEHFASFGFAVLDFAGPQVRVRYIDENGKEHQREDIPKLTVGDPLNLKDTRWRFAGGGGGARAGRRSKGGAIPELGGGRRGGATETTFRGWSLLGGDYLVGGRGGGGLLKPRHRGSGGQTTKKSAGKTAKKSAKKVGFGGPSAQIREAKKRTTRAVAAETIRRRPHLDVPTSPLPLNHEFKVAVYADTAKAREGEESEDIVIKTEKSLKQYPVSVSLVTTKHFTLLDPQPKTMLINIDEAASDPVEFRVKTNAKVEQPENASISAMFTYRGRASGRVTRKVKLDLPTNDSGMPTPPTLPKRLAPEDAMAFSEKANEPDLTLQIFDPDNTLRSFMFEVATPHLAECKVGKRVTWNLNNQTSNIVADYFRQFVNASDNDQRLDGLRGAGIQLFDATPEAFKEAFWRLVDLKKPFRSISIVSEEPYIPWELMIPHRPGKAPAADALPIGMQFAVARWLRNDHLLPNQRLQLKSSCIFAPKYPGPKPRPLTHSGEEAMLVAKVFPGKRITPATYAQFKSAMQAGSASVLHFICHGADSTPAAQCIYMEAPPGGTMSSTQVTGMAVLTDTFKKTKPLIFLNACEVGRTTPALVGVGGFAKAFLDAGASCVIAPLWSVDDSVALKVATRFYNIISRKRSTPLASILREIRELAYKGKTAGVDSYAAYCFYGDPLAVRG